MAADASRVEFREVDLSYQLVMTPTLRLEKTISVWN